MHIVIHGCMLTIANTQGARFWLEIISVILLHVYTSHTLYIFRAALFTYFYEQFTKLTLGSFQQVL